LEKQQVCLKMGWKRKGKKGELLKWEGEQN